MQPAAGTPASAWARGLGAALALCLSLDAAAAPKNEAAAPSSEQQEIDLGDDVASALLGNVALVADDAAQEYVNLVGRWVASQTARPRLPWEFGIIERGEIAAFPIPGGKVLITRGLLSALKDEAELAAVLAHEIGHVASRHQMRNLDGVDPRSMAAINTPLPPADELEADRVAVGLLARAGYDTAALGRVLTRFNALAKRDAGLQLLSKTHPPYADRMANINTALRDLKPQKLVRGEQRFRAVVDALAPAAKRE